MSGNSTNSFPTISMTDKFSTLRKKITSQRLELVDVFVNKTVEDKATLLASIETQRHSRLIKDLLIHSIFFIAFVAIILMQLNPDSVYKVNDSLKQSLVYDEIPGLEFAKSYDEIDNPGDFQNYIINLFAPAVQEMNFNNSLAMNKIIGETVRVRVLRVKENSCPNTGLDIICYSNSYNKDTKDRISYGGYEATHPGSNVSLTGMPYEGPFKYTSNSGGSFVFGYNQYVYDRSGYYLDIPLYDTVNNVSIVQYFEQLFENGFFDVQVRAVIISFITLNLNYESRATSTALLTEWTAAGSVNAYYSMRTYRIEMYINAIDRFRAFLEITFLVFLVYYLYYFLNEGRIDYKLNRIRYYILSFKNILDLINLTLFVTSVALYLAFLGNSDRKITNSILDQGYKVYLEDLGQTALVLYQLSAINILILAFKTFRFLVVHRRLYVLWITLSEAKLQLITFTVMFIIVMFGFLFASWATFGVQMSSFNGFISSLGTLLQFIIGNPPDYSEMAYTNRALGPIFYVLFTIFMFFILVNMFVAIISNSYSEINERINRKQSEKRYLLTKFQRYLMSLKFLFRSHIYDLTTLVMLIQKTAPQILLDKNVTNEIILQEIKKIDSTIRDDELNYYADLVMKVHRSRKKYLKQLLLLNTASEFELRLMGGQSKSFSFSFNDYVKKKKQKKKKVASMDQKIEHLQKQLNLIMKALNIDPIDPIDTSTSTPTPLNNNNNNNNNNIGNSSSSTLNNSIVPSSIITE
ncbi:putative Ca2+ channel [Tieghemostelium lacteum]|uniref:Putative Ca2+ channel n=1 Tax=Tieghemostelium lacteum TaxID=361077 RepID=A0A151ZKA5_TIELA|nr:putative Ca2+ channel [Tieghemostelium lacteum]|eukprot:KYQ94421.1 putative Ca2+ channel [Tieghemostelium lacteum]